MAPRKTTPKQPAKQPAKRATQKAAPVADSRDELIAALMQKLADQELTTSQLVQRLAETPMTAIHNYGGARSNTARMVGAPGQFFVGIRNVSAYTISIPNKVTGEPELNLHAPRADRADPKTVAIVSYAWWQQLRQDRHYARGMIIRDDSILGGLYEAAPPDRPQDCHPDHAKNVLIDAESWLATASDDEITDRIMAMTSEHTLHKLEALVVTRRRELMDKHVDLEWKERKRRVERELPSKLKHLFACVKERLHELAPKHD
jgi:hypothetical protein